jgi:hypothetical protein
MFKDLGFKLTASVFSVTANAAEKYKFGQL